MFREKPSLILAVAEASEMALPEGTTAVSLGEAHAPVHDYLPDTLVGLQDARGVLVRVIVVEVQLQKKDVKVFSLPVYQALARARHRVPCDVFVLTPARTVADWLRRPIALGGGSRFCARVVGPRELLRLDARRRREHDPRDDLTAEIVFLRTVADRGNDLALAVESAHVFEGHLTEARAALYFDVMFSALPATKRRLLERLMQKERLRFQSEFMRNLVKEGLSEGIERGLKRGLERGMKQGVKQGLEKGLEEGLEKGRAEACGHLREAIRICLAANAVPLSKEQERRLDACDDVAQLNEWLQRAARPETARDVFPRARRKKRAARTATRRAR